MNARHCRFAFALSAVLSTIATAQVAPRHPLDPLTGAEMTLAVSTLRASGRLTAQARFGSIVVNPQDKRDTLARAARIIGYDWQTNEAFLAVVDLAKPQVASFTVVDSEPPMRVLIIRRLNEIAQKDPRWVAALRRRGIDTTRVNMLPSLAERARLQRKGTDRMATAFMWNRDEITGNATPRITVIANLTQGRLEGIITPDTPTYYSDSSAVKAFAAQRSPLPPLTISQPAGSAIRVSGNVIQWDRWRLRVGIDPRRGLEVHDVSLDEAGVKRSVLYSGSLSEIVAPYGDSTFGTWYPRDEGDYGMGLYGLEAAVPFNDAPANARYLPATMHDHLGRPVVVSRAIAIYERDGGLLWRHARMSRRARQLVVSTQATIDNYDYVFTWVFGQDGTIESDVTLSGVMNINGTKRMVDTAHADGHSQLGHLVAPGVNAPNHQHFFSYRLDFDVDGERNTLYAMDTHAADSAANPKGELIAMQERPVGSEKAAMQNVSWASARSWRVANTSRRNALGQFTGYTLVPGSTTPAFALPGSAPLRTSGFMAHQVWATPYAPEEQYAGGEFQNLGRDNEGLVAWTSTDRPLLDRDIVVWYTLGITHIPRPEDWPYMPSHRGSFKLVPTSFFSRNPTLDVPAARR